MRRIIFTLLMTSCFYGTAHASPYLQVQDLREGAGAKAVRHSVALARVDGGEETGYELDGKMGSGPVSRDQGIENALIGMRVGGERRVTIHEPDGEVSHATIRLVDVAPTVDDMTGRHGNFTVAEVDSVPVAPHRPPVFVDRQDPDNFSNLPNAPIPAPQPAPAPFVDRGDPDNFSNLPNAPMPPVSTGNYARSPLGETMDTSSPSYSSPAQEQESGYSVSPPAYAPPAPSSESGSLYGDGPSLRDPTPSYTTHEEPSEFYNKGGDSEFFNRGGTTEFHDHNETSDFNHTNTESSQ